MARASDPSERIRLGAAGSAFVALHAGCLLAPAVGVGRVALAAAAAAYLARMFGITAGYHRYFSHRSFRASRPVQLLLGLLGASAMQKGPLWWAGYHRHHHLYSDTELDIHSPSRRGFWWSHMGWMLSRKYEATRFDAVPDLARYPELVWLDRWHVVPGVALGIFMLGLGAGLKACGVATSAMQLFVWGFLISTVALYHGTFVINSLAHVIGRRRFETEDDSRNSLLLALITLGEGWHNNHHRCPYATRQGLFWWELDVTHLTLKLMAGLGLVSDLRKPPPEVYQEARGGPKPFERRPRTVSFVA